MKKYLILSASFIILLLTFLGCKKENLCDCFKSTGSETIIYRDLTNSFDTVLMKDKLDVYLIEDTIDKIEIHGGKHLVNLVHTDVANNKLTITNNNKCNFVRSYKRRIKVYVHVTNLKSIVQNGVGNLYCVNDITSDSLTYQIFNSGDLHLKVNNLFLRGGVNGMGDIYAEGTTLIHNSNIKGEGFLFAESLNTQTSDLIMKTSGTSKITANSQIILTLTQSGNVYYHGNPSVIQTSITGSGKLIPF